MYEQNLSYSSINSARSALSAILQISGTPNNTFGEHPDVKRFMKGIYQNRPPMPRYNKTWDVDIVLQYLRNMNDSEDLSLKDLTLKLVMLIALTTAGRGQSLHLLNIETMVKENNCLAFVIASNIKQSRPTSSLTDRIIKLKAYPLEKKLCVFHTCSVYMEKTSSLRGQETCLLLTHQKPHKRASKDSIRRWIQSVMSMSGVDVNVYKPHSVRSAATSKAKANHVPLDGIMKAAGWSSASTFAKFYDKQIESDVTFSEIVLG